MMTKKKWRASTPNCMAPGALRNGPTWSTISANVVSHRTDRTDRTDGTSVPIQSAATRRTKPTAMSDTRSSVESGMREKKGCSTSTFDRSPAPGTGVG